MVDPVNPFFQLFVSIIKLPLFSDVCVFLHCFWNNQFHTGILDLPPKEYLWGNRLLYFRFPDNHRIFTDTTPFLYHGHNPVHFSVSQRSVAKIQPNYPCKCNFNDIKKIAWIPSHHLHLQWKFKLLVGKFAWGVEAKDWQKIAGCCEQTFENKKSDDNAQQCFAFIPSPPPPSKFEFSLKGDGI